MNLLPLSAFKFYLTSLLLVITFSLAFAQSAQELKEKLAKADDVEEKIKLNGQICELTLSTDSSSLFYCQEALKLIEENEAYELKYFSDVQLNVGIYMALRGRYPEALEALKVRLDYVIDRNRDTTIAETYRLIGNVFASSAQFDSALISFIAAQEQFSLIGAESSNLYLSMGGVNAESGGDPETTIRYYKKALQIATDKGQKVQMANAYLSMSNEMLRRQAYDSAIHYGQLAAERAKEIDQFRVMGAAERFLGIAYKEQAQYQRAIDHFREAITILESIDFKRGLGETYDLLGSTYERLGKLDDAEYWVTKGMEVNHSIGLMNHYKEGLRILHEVNMKKGDYEAALANFKRFKSLEDSIQNKEKVTRIEELQAQFQASMRENEIRILKQEKEYDQLRQIALVIGLGLTLIIGVALFGRQRAKRALAESELELKKSEQEQLNRELDYKNREIVDFALQITERDEFLEKLNREAKSVSHKGQADERELKAITEMVRNHMSLTKRREEFEAHVESVYDSFFKKLDEKFPGLTPNEKRLAALLRVNLSSKEIASVINISPKSVDMNRYRLRKKMNLDSDDNLADILKAL
ncbi:MAG: tetratricopeptide repeat protein [Bacteroidota bacterium]